MCVCVWGGGGGGGEGEPVWTACAPEVKITRVGGGDILGYLHPQGAR